MNEGLSRRFSGVARLFGETVFTAYTQAHICVVGIGGVGSWAVEALARSGIGALTLIDLDMVAESNVNRQIHALPAFFGAAKVDVMAERAVQINPACQILTIEDFVTPENVASLLSAPFDAVIDATDQVRAKAAMAVFCRQHRMPLVMAGAAGGKTDPTRIQIADLARTVQDPLLAKVRARLRRNHGFERDPQRKLGVTVVYSDEPARALHAEICQPFLTSGLSCTGLGSSVCVTAVLGFTAARQALAIIAKQS